MIKLEPAILLNTQEEKAILLEDVTPSIKRGEKRKKKGKEEKSKPQIAENITVKI